MAAETDLIDRINENCLRLLKASEQARSSIREEMDQEKKRLEQGIKEHNDSIRHQQLTLKHNHETALDALATEVGQIEQQAGCGTADWSDEGWEHYESSPVPPELYRIGELELTGPYSKLKMSAVLPFTEGKNVIIRSAGAARDDVIRGMQSMVLRLLALTPPSKLRLLFIDPVGMGQNAGLFNKLMDIMPELISGKVWSDSKDIEKQLIKLSAHMETVIQTYLQGQFKTIEEYNLEAGEVAEPYYLVVVVNFPQNFTEEAARRLMSIAANGPSCGVLTYLLQDTGLSLPRSINMGDLEANSIVIRESSKSDGWVIEAEDLNEGVMRFDSPPPQEQFIQLLDEVGRCSVMSSRVEVPIEKLIPVADRWWQGSTARELKAAIGRAGARKTQYFELGRGTAQHALVAGQTGSGKSTLFHTLILNLATTYSPEELELYLIDFKKGVEFKDYATYQLPHVRVVAIESEREFGISVLEGLDEELERRGQIFRQAGVSSLSEYRALTEEASLKETYGILPRILLIVDEFQEFFSDDDHISSQAKLLLDRLTRQGRAFGIHLFMGSQSLAGTANLGRSITDQMGVRIAMKCSEADSRIILNEDNPAARLLTRPGEAFYNAMNGMKEANVRFQVAWLENSLKIELLKKIHQTSRLTGKGRQPIVFEGNKLPCLLDNTQVSSPEWLPKPTTVTMYLGEPISIKPPTGALFARRPGKNLIVVGKNEDQGVGILLNGLLSLAAQLSPEDSQFYLCDFTLQGSEDSTILDTIQDSLPHNVRMVPARKNHELVEEIYNTVQARLQEDRVSGPAIYYLVLGLHRARDLRRTGQYRKPADPLTPGEQLASILHDGPEVDVHVCTWIDSYPSLNNIQDRLLNEFGLRVGLTMSEMDSRSLFDTSTAAKLAPDRSLLLDDETMRLEKFIPYAGPDKKVVLALGEIIKNKGNKK